MMDIFAKQDDSDEGDEAIAGGEDQRK